MSCNECKQDYSLSTDLITINNTLCPICRQRINDSICGYFFQMSDIGKNGFLTLYEHNSLLKLQKDIGLNESDIEINNKLLYELFYKSKYKLVMEMNRQSFINEQANIDKTLFEYYERPEYWAEGYEMYRRVYALTFFQQNKYPNFTTYLNLENREKCAFYAYCNNISPDDIYNGILYVTNKRLIFMTRKKYATCKIADIKHVIASANVITLKTIYEDKPYQYFMSDDIESFIFKQAVLYGRCYK